MNVIATSSQKRAVVDELHRPARRNFPRRKVEIRGIFDLWQADLVEMIPYASVNRGYKYMLTCIDACSKMAWAEPTKTKNMEDVTAAMEKILKKAKRAPKNLQVDKGSEFYNSRFEALMRKRGINLYSSYTTKKASIIERFNRTLKTRMWKMFSLQGSYKWVDRLDGLLHEYNHSMHRSIGMKPADVRVEHEAELVRRLSENRQKYPSNSGKRLQAGDKVRLSKEKALFEKGYTPNWGTEIFKIAAVRQTKPVTYILEDLNGSPIKGAFYREELQKTKYPDVYLVEKVLRRNKNKAYVKWLGFDSSHNQWMDSKNIL